MMLRLSFMAAFAALLFACPPSKTKADAGRVDAGCAADDDCPDPALFSCNQTSHACEPSCHSKADCSNRGAFPIDYCATGRGCECDEGSCVASLCSADSDCGSPQVCRNGQCATAPTASAVANCQVTPDYALLRGGAKTKFWVSAYDANNSPVVVKEGATWAAKNSLVAGTATGTSFEVTAGDAATSATAADVEAAFGSVKCTAQIQVVAKTVALGNLSALATDELTGRPIANATLLLSDSGGTAIVSGTTGTNGVASVVLPVNTTTVNATLFHADYNYLTIVGYNTLSVGADARFLSFVVRRNQVDKFGGYKGTLKNVPTTPNVHAGIIGASVAGSITDLSPSQLVGPSVKTDINIGGVFMKPGQLLPLGVYLGYSGSTVKDQIGALGLAGVCSKLSNAEGRMSTGECGTRSAWALTGDVGIADLTPLFAAINNGSLAGADYGSLLGQLAPLMKKFNSSVVRDVEFTLKPGSIYTADGGSDLADFTAVDHEFAQVPLAFNFVTKIPDLPQLRNQYVGGAVILSGTLAEGRGMIPLGLGAAVNSAPADAKTDKQNDLDPGLATVRMAPTHHGLEGSEYVFVVLGLSLQGTGSFGGIATSAIVGRTSALSFDPRGNSPVDLKQTFLGFPEDAHYNYSNTAKGALGGRSFKMADAAKVAGASLVRVAFADPYDHRWVVYLEPSQVVNGFTLPTPPAGFTAADRTFDNGNSGSGGRSTLTVQAVKLNDNPSSSSGAAISLTKLIELNSTNADHLSNYTVAFSVLDYFKPTVSYKTPTVGASVHPGSNVVVVVSGFRVGSTAAEDGYVRLSFSGGTGCTGVVEQKAYSAADKGEVTLALPSSCTGAVTLHTELVGGDDLTLDPRVWRDRDVTIAP